MGTVTLQRWHQRNLPAGCEGVVREPCGCCQGGGSSSELLLPKQHQQCAWLGPEDQVLPVPHQFPNHLLPPNRKLAAPQDVWPVPQAPGGGSALGTGDVPGGCAPPALLSGHRLRHLAVRQLLAPLWRHGGDGWVWQRAGGDAMHQRCIFPPACPQQDLGSPPSVEDFWEMGVSCKLLLHRGVNNTLLVQGQVGMAEKAFRKKATFCPATRLLVQSDAAAVAWGSW